MALADLTLLLIGRDSLAEQLHVHLEHRGADIERAAADEALDTIRVAVPDLVIVSADASGKDAERMRDALATEARPPRMLVLCEKKHAAQTGTYKHDFIATLEPELGAELIASSIESLCTLLAKQGTRPLRSLVADVRRSQMPARPLAPIAAPPPAAGAKPLAAVRVPKTTLLGTPPAPIAAPPPAAKPIATSTSAAPALPPGLPSARPPAPQPPAVEVVAEPAEEVEIFESIPPIDTAQTPPMPAPVVLAAVPAPEPSGPSEPSEPAVIAAPAFAARVQRAAHDFARVARPHARALLAGAARAQQALVRSAHALLARLTRAQQLIAAAAVLLCAIGVAAAGMSGQRSDPITPDASASLAAVAKPAKPSPAPPSFASIAPAPPPSADARPEAAPEPKPASPEPEDEADGDEESESDGELYDPKADPARARANFHVNAGHRLRKQGRLGMAEASYLKALKAVPHYARAVSGLVGVHLARRDGIEALRWARKLVELQPKRGTHQRLLGDAYALTGAKAAARQAWQQGARLGDRISRKRMQ